MRHIALLSLLMVSACAETTEPEAPAPDSPSDSRQIEQAVVDADGPNWITVGVGGRVELIGGEDGEPDVTSGRFALDANPISDTSSGNGRWIVVGQGLLQALDSDANRLRQVREILAGESGNFIERGNMDWLTGGGAGQLQTIDNEGEPTNNVAQVLGGTTDLTAAGFNGTSWLVGSADGRTLKVERDLQTTSAESTPFGGDPVTGIVGRGSGWLAFSADSWTGVSAVGNAGTVVQIEAGLQITEVVTIDGTVFIGTADGRVGAFDPATVTSSGWENVFSTGEITKIVASAAGPLVALSSNGEAALLDANGAVTTTATQAVPNLALEGAWFADGRWLMAAGPIGFIRFIGDDLSPVRTLTPLLDGNDIHGLSPNADGALLVGAGGRTQFVDSLGNPIGTVETIGTSSDVLDAEWNGENFLTVAADGTAEVVSGNGTPQGGAVTALEGGRLEFASWSGEFWLVGGEGGRYQRIRRDGTLADAAPIDIAEMTDARDARFSGSEWMIGGTTSDGKAAVSIIAPSGDLTQTVIFDDFPGSIETVEYNGIEWVVAGTGGLFQRVNPEGGPVGAPQDLLNGYDVYTIEFNGQTLLAGGEFGSVRQFTRALQPLRPALGVLDSRTVSALNWTSPRGFPAGPCLTNDSCYVGPCVGGISEGVCCDSACNQPCESCFLEQTGESDGTCAPVVAGRRPPVKIHIQSPGCQAQPATTCGTTGTCDGAGACSFYESGTLCGSDAECSAVTFTPAQTCVGDGSPCTETVPVSCEPYTVCTVDGGCATSCADDSDCFEGLVCEETQCVEPTEMPEMPTETDDDADGGCCAVAPATPTDDHIPALFLLFAGGALLLRRRS